MPLSERMRIVKAIIEQYGTVDGLQKELLAEVVRLQKELDEIHGKMHVTCIIQGPTADQLREVIEESLQEVLKDRPTLVIPEDLPTFPPKEPHKRDRKCGNCAKFGYICDRARADEKRDCWTNVRPASYFG